MAKQLTADEESTLKRQARRRLIGAVALTTAVVVILPMVFDSEPTSNVNDIELRIPDKDKVGEFHASSAVGIASAVPAVLAPLAVSAAVPETVVAASAIVVPVVATPIAASSASGQVQEGKIEHPKVEAAKPPKTEAKPKDEAKPKVESKPAATKHAVPQSGFVVQVGAFSNADSAKTMQDKLGKQGLHAYTEKVGNNVRVRVGSFPTHEAAEKVRRKLESQGLHPNVVNLGG